MSSRITAGARGPGTARRIRRRRADSRGVGSNLRRPFASITDGLSNTILGAEVKTYMPSYHDCGGGAAAGARLVPYAYPRRPHRPREYCGGPDVGMQVRHGLLGHAGRWSHSLVQRQFVLRRVHHRVAAQHPIPGQVAGPRQRHELRGWSATAARRMRAVTSRSYHPGGVNALFADGLACTPSRTRSTGKPGGPWGRSAAAR